MVLAQKIGTGILRLTNIGMLKAVTRLSQEVSALEPGIAALSDDEILARVGELRSRAVSGSSLDDLLPEAFAIVREAGKRVLGQRAFDVQVMGGIALHRGLITQMKTGEGKTLAATMPAFLNALTGRGVHIVTVNDYLVRRDAEWMGPIFRFLGMSVSTVTSTMELDKRRQAYQADVTYAVHVEVAFDYLRDNMCLSLDKMVQRGLNYVIVDEVDSVLIDEARMPIEVMNETDQTPDTCYAVDRLVREIDSVYIELDEKKRRVQLTEEGIDYVEQLLIRDGLIKHGHLYDLDNVYLVHLVGQALHARYIYKRDKDYVIKDNEVVLVDELRGRMLVGRRLGEGLHEAIEAKEGLPLRKQGAVVAKTTYQNYFRLYEKLSGMTGTATMDVEEYRQIYNIQVLEIPTNLPMIRADLDDEVYRSEEDKLNAVVERIRKSHARGQPVLIGTTSVGKSEALAAILSRENIVHEVLNARHHEREAEIIASAGRLGAVTIATNMAGRGTDIQLGGNLEVRLAQEVAGLVDQDEAARKTAEIKAEIAAEREAVRQAGGLLILGTERFYCRRIDDQLIGRAGRQGDPGESVFMLSLDDDLIRVFGAGDMLKRRLKKVGFAPGEAMFHSWLTRAIRKAQEALEEMFIQARMEVLDYDDVSDTQRKLVYEMRREILSADSFEERLDEVRAQVVDELVERHMPRNAYAEQWDIAGLKTELLDMFNLVVPVEAWAAEEGIANEEMHQRIERAVTDLWSMRLASFSDEERWRLVRELSLMTLDECWRLHIAALDYLRFGINLRAIAQRVPLYEYRTEAFSFFEEMLLRHRDNLVRAVSRMMPIGAAEPAPPLPSHGTFVAQHVRRIGPCPCGSGKRFKDCHGRMGDALTSRPTAADQRRVPGRLFIPQMHEVGVTTNRVVFGSRAD